MQEARRAWPQIILNGTIAGLVGGILIDAYAIVGRMLETGGAGPALLNAGATPFYIRLYQYDASVLVGKVAYDNPNYAWLGVAIHFGISIVWGIGYAYAATQSPQLETRPFISGIVYGLVVYFVMMLVQLTSGTWTTLTSSAILNGLVGHTLFFGIPVAYIVRSRRTSAASRSGV